MNSNEASKIEIKNGREAIIIGALSLLELNDQECVVQMETGKLILKGFGIEMINFHESQKKIEFRGLFEKIELTDKKTKKKNGFINKLIK